MHLSYESECGHRSHLDSGKFPGINRNDAVPGAVDIHVYFAMYPELRRPFSVANVVLPRRAAKPSPSWPPSPHAADQPRAPSQSRSVTLF